MIACHADHIGSLLRPPELVSARGHAASVAGLLLTTEVMIAESPKDEEHAHGAPGGGMGGLDM